MKPRSQGFTLLEMIVVISIMGILGVVLAGRLQRYAAVAEKTSMEYTANQINTALTFEFASRMTKGRREVQDMLAVNPVKLLAQKPINYLGEYRDPPAGEEYEGHWYFDSERRELVYLVRRGDDFLPDSEGKKRVRYRVKLLFDEPEPGAPKQLVGAIIELIEPYKWL